MSADDTGGLFRDPAGVSAVVTGGSRGLGAALGAELARAGARVVLVARGRVELDAVAAAIRAEGGEAHALALDVAAPGAAAAVAGAAAALVGPIDLLIHNASSLGPTPLRPLSDTAAEDLVRVLDLNLVAPFRITRAIVGSMVLRGAGLVVHVTSDAGTHAYPGWGAYSVSKAGLDHLTRVWAAELRDAGVRFLSLDPGEMRTRMHAEAVPDADPAALRDPAEVACSIVALLREADRIASGARIDVMSWRPPV